VADKKTIFIAFAKEDERIRNMLTGQRTNGGTPFEFIDMSVKEAYESDWKAKVQTRIRRSDGVIALISASTNAATGEVWEIQTAIAEGVPLMGIWVGDYRTKPAVMGSAPCREWTWPNLSNFIDSL
jgi:nucleoside 2-deoxyribosyltransferase